MMYFDAEKPKPLDLRMHFKRKREQEGIKLFSPMLRISFYNQCSEDALHFKDYINRQNKDGNTLLHIALSIPDCNLSEIISLLRHGASVGMKNLSGETPLNYAVYHNTPIEAVKLLMQYGATVYTSDNKGDTPLHRALASPIPNIEVINLLLLRGASVKPNSQNEYPVQCCIARNFDFKIFRLLSAYSDMKITDKNNRTLLHLALEKELDLEVIHYLLDWCEIEVNAPDNKGDTALQVALRSRVRRAAIIKKLLDKGADCNLNNYSLDYPLHTALKHKICTLPLLQLLLLYGARVFSRDGNGDTILHVACSRGYSAEAIRMLLNARGADVNDVNLFRDNLLATALQCQLYGPINPSTMKPVEQNPDPKMEVIKLLLDSGACTRMANLKGNTALHVALRWNCSIEIIELLLNHGADINQKNATERSPLCMALLADVPDIDTIRYLISRNADVMVTDNLGHTCLHLAVWSTNVTVEILDLFLEHKVDINALNIQGEMAIHLALVGSDKEIVQFLLDKGSNVHAVNREGNYPLAQAVYDHSVGIADHEDFSKLLIRYTLLQDDTIDIEEILEECGDSGQFMDYTRQCRAEIEGMRSEYVLDGMTLWLLISDRRPHVVKRWKEREWDIKHILAVLYKNKYPAYSYVISKIIKRQYMLDQLRETSFFAVREGTFIVLNYHCVCSLVQYLPNMELLAMLAAFYWSRTPAPPTIALPLPPNAGIILGKRSNEEYPKCTKLLKENR